MRKPVVSGDPTGGPARPPGADPHAPRKEPT